MSDPMQQSLEGHSEFIPFNASTTMEQSLQGISQKIHLDNASYINQQQLMKDRQTLLQMGATHAQQPIAEQEEGEESVNQFLHVGKWNKSKRSKLSKSPDTPKQDIKQQNQHQQDNNPQASTSKSAATVNTSKWNANATVNASKQMSQVNESQKSYLQSGSQINKSKMNGSKGPLTKPEESKWHPHANNRSLDSKKQNQAQKEEDEQEEDQDQDDEEEEEEEQSESPDQSSQGEPQENSDGSEKGWDEQEPQPEQEEQEETSGDNHSSSVYQTQNVKTEQLNESSKSSKWAKKKPLETTTKYETRAEQIQVKSRGYYSRLDSTSFARKGEDVEQVTEEQIAEEEGEDESQWEKVEKVLLRLKKIIE